MIKPEHAFVDFETYYRASMPAIRFSTGVVPPRDRAPLFQDEVARRFINAEMRINPAYTRPFHFDMALAVGDTLRLAQVDFAAVDVARRQADLRDGDDGITCFLPTGSPVRTEHGGIRGIIRPGGAVLVGHGTPGASRWPDNHVTLLMLRRAAFSDPAAMDAAAGHVHPPNRPILRLLRAYLRSVWKDAGTSGFITADGERTVVAMLQGLAATTPEGMRRAAWPALGPARVAAMREAIRRRAAEPELSMREIAAAVGLSERSGHLVLARANLNFTECVTEARMDRVRARLEAGALGRIIDIALEAGFGDIAHFNRLFRRRFGMTPTDMLHRRGRPEG